jgi:hypothetical protein
MNCHEELSANKLKRSVNRGFSRLRRYTDLLKDVAPKPGMTKTETYEEWAKDLFKKEPANMKLLVVVDKLLTGFDAPPCTYLYIDKSMQDHGLFQAICRTNRLDGDDKDFGYIIDYKDLFKKVENAIAVYTSELDHSSGGAAPEVLLQDRLKKGKERLDNALEVLALLCEPVEPPKGELEHIHYFCGNTKFRQTSRSGNHGAPHSTKPSSVWCARMPTSPTNSRPRGTAPTISHASSGRWTSTSPFAKSSGRQRRKHRSEGL